MLRAEEVLVIIPAFNEERSVGRVVSDVRRLGYQCLVVDDGSTDQTFSAATTAGAEAIRLRNNLGVGGALRAGFRFAVERGFMAAIQVDADGQHPVEEITKLIASANEANAHMVIGSRFLADERSMTVSALRRVVMLALSYSASRAAQTRVTDATSGFRLIRRPLLGEFSKSFPTNYLGDTYEAVVTAGRSGYKIVEVSASLVNREHGTSSASTSQAVTLTLKALAVSLLRVHFQIARFDEHFADDRL